MCAYQSGISGIFSWATYLFGTWASSGCSSYAVGRTTRRHPATSSRIFFPLHLFSPRSFHRLSTAKHCLSMHAVLLLPGKHFPSISPSIVAKSTLSLLLFQWQYLASSGTIYYHLQKDARGLNNPTNTFVRIDVLIFRCIIHLFHRWKELFQQEAICYQWFKQRLILRVSEPSISQRSQIKEDTVEPSVPAREFNLKAIRYRELVGCCYPSFTSCMVTHPPAYQISITTSISFRDTGVQKLKIVGVAYTLDAPKKKKYTCSPSICKWQSTHQILTS